MPSAFRDASVLGLEGPKHAPNAHPPSQGTLTLSAPSHRIRIR